MFERSGYMTGYYPTKDAQGRNILLIVVKRTYDINVVEAKCEPTEEQAPILIGDEYFDGEDPFQSSVKYESELAPWKTKKDIVFVGKAYAPDNKPAGSWDVQLMVGEYKRKLRVFGPREVTWVPPRESGRGKKKTQEPQPPKISRPKRVTEVELTYENAYGGFATYFPEDPASFRKAVDKAQTKLEAQQEKEKAEAEKQRQSDEEAKAAADKAAAKAQQREDQNAFFSDGIKDISEAPDVALEVETGSARKKAPGGTVILDKAELAEAIERDQVAAKQAGDKAPSDGPEIDEDGAIKIAADELAQMAAEDTLDAELARAAREQASHDVDGTRVIDLADQGKQLESDGNWIAAQKEERERLYQEWGTTPQEAVSWEEGDFPRIPLVSNPVGLGFALRNCKESLDGLEMPQVEDPARLIQPEDLPVTPATLHLPRPAAAGFGFYSRSWMPRTLMAGLRPDEIAAAQHELDKQLVEKLNPEDEDDQLTIEALLDREATAIQPDYYNGANPVWQVETLKGDEQVHMTHLCEEGTRFFSLPGPSPLVRFDRGEGWETVDVTLDTLVIDNEEKKVFMLWRGSVFYGGVEELGDYPRTEIDIQDMSVTEWQERVDDEELAAVFEDKTAIIDLDELSEEDAAEFEQRIEQAAIGKGGIKEELVIDAREGVRADDGALLDIHGDELLITDDDWIEKAKLRGLSDDEIAKIKQTRDERARIREEKNKLREKIAAIKKQKADAEAKAKKKKAPKAKATQESKPKAKEPGKPKARIKRKSAKKPTRKK